jgi:hypothetical protein
MENFLQSEFGMFHMFIYYVYSYIVLYNQSSNISLRQHNNNFIKLYLSIYFNYYSEYRQYSTEDVKKLMFGLLFVHFSGQYNMEYFYKNVNKGLESLKSVNVFRTVKKEDEDKDKECMLYKKMLNKRQKMFIDYYTNFVVRLNSPVLLKMYSKICNLNSDFDKKRDLILCLSNVLQKVGERVKKEFNFDLVLNSYNEINLIYKYEEKNDNNELLYLGDINKILTRIVSQTSIIFHVYFKEHEQTFKSIIGNCDVIDEKIFNQNVFFFGELVLLDTEDNVNEWIKWRRLDLDRNCILNLYKCFTNDKSCKLTKKEMSEYLNNEIAHFDVLYKQINKFE